MKILDYTKFGEELFSSIGLFQGKFDEKKWNEFLKKYFSEKELEKLMTLILSDISFFKLQDPASKEYTLLQILSIRRGMVSIIIYRVFQTILSLDKTIETLFEIEVLAKSVQVATSVEIHPQAKLGKSFAIDHGHGTVIGATTETGENIFCYHGVTLGATGRALKNGRRHPKIGNDVFLGNGVQILGPSLLGDNIVISSETMVVDAVVESNVRISPGILISKVRIPEGYMIFGFDSFSRKFIGRKPESTKKVETFELERIDITNV